MRKFKVNIPNLTVIETLIVIFLLRFKFIEKLVLSNNDFYGHMTKTPLYKNENNTIKALLVFLHLKKEEEEEDFLN